MVLSIMKYSPVWDNIQKNLSPKLQALMLKTLKMVHKKLDFVTKDSANAESKSAFE